VKRTLLVALCLVLVAPAAADAARPGAPGIGDPYFPNDGNGGYDVAHYGLAITYTPATRRLRGVATIDATAKHDLSSFNLDFRGPRVRSVKVGGRAARWRRKGGELTIVPRAFLRRRRAFTTVIAYDGRPKAASESGLGSDDGFMPTDDGALVAGEPHGAATWFPVNEHPRDKASYSFRITVPRGVEAIANGVLLGVQHTRHGGGNVTTSQFVALAERVSGRRLDGFFRTWLFTPAKPAA
jgi:aminopeptidase N